MLPDLDQWWLALLYALRGEKADVYQCSICGGYRRGFWSRCPR